MQSASDGSVCVYFLSEYCTKFWKSCDILLVHDRCISSSVKHEEIIRDESKCLSENVSVYFSPRSVVFLYVLIEL